MKAILVALIAATVAVSSDKSRFDNYRFYSVNIENEVQLKALRELSEVSDSYSFVDPPAAIGSSVDVIVPPHQRSHWSEISEKFGLTMTLNSNNFQELVDMSEPKRAPRADGYMDWTAYFSTGEIHAWMMRLQQIFPQYLTLEDIGVSYEGWPIKLMRLSKQSGNRAIFIEGNIHAREWISGATTTYILNELLFSSDPVIQELAQNIDWHIIPISNPDGYEHSRNSNRNWRKTRSEPSILCRGVDPNRNFEFNWMTPDEGGNLGASTNPCSETFAGDRPFSESETAAIDDYLSRHFQQFDIYLSMHSFAHMILHPLGTSRAPISNFNEHQTVANTAVTYLNSVHGMVYTYGSAITLLYAASGTSPDHAWGRYNISLAYTYEMRGNGPYGNFGFVLPPHLIIPNCEEVMASLIGMASEARNFGYLRR